MTGATQIATLLQIEGVVRSYAWGSRTAIPDLLGLPPSVEPVAELWLGAHVDAPSRVRGQASTLDQLIEADPIHMLGEQVYARFGARLPFLLKVLAADKALSIQVHPTLAQAKEAYARQESDQGASVNYTDDNHKPELVCALTPFEAFCGFRPGRQILDLLEAIERENDFGDAHNLVLLWRNELARPDGIRAGFRWLYQLPTQDVTALVRYLVAGCGRLATEMVPWRAAAAAITRVANDFPDDIGLAVAIMLNHVVLQPGEALFLDAGNVHAYIGGLAIEIMANSDNVLRCGLTHKPVDAAEVLRIADFTPLIEPRFAAVRQDRCSRFAPPVADFSLGRWAFDTSEPAVLPAGSPQVLFVTDGAFTLSTDENCLTLNKGEAVFVPATEQVEVSGLGTLFQAGPGIL